MQNLLKELSVEHLMLQCKSNCVATAGAYSVKFANIYVSLNIDLQLVGILWIELWKFH